MFCSKCGKEIKNGIQFCSTCGSPLEHVTVKCNENFSNRQCVDEKNGFTFAVPSKRTNSHIVLIVVLFILIAALSALILHMYLPIETSQDNSSTQELGQGDYEPKIIQAIDAIQQKWKSLYEDSDADGYLEIKNTRVISIMSNAGDYWDGIDCVIEFVLYTDYFCSSPYHSNANISDAVIFYVDGTYQVTNNPFRMYSARTYIFDYSGLIESISDFHGGYNDVVYLM